MAEPNLVPGTTPEEKEKMLKLLENSYKMYEKTKKETERTLKSQLDDNGNKKNSQEDIKKQVKLIENAQDGIITQYQYFGGNPEDLKNKKTRKTQTGVNANIMDMVKRTMAEDNVKVNTNIDQMRADADNRLIAEIERRNFMPSVEQTNSMAGFDIIPLPSNGECYPNKISKVPVSPLCASDENMIIAPNLYRDNLVLDYILKAKIQNNEIDPMDMLDGDREAILLWLRTDGYGPEYPITATNEKTGEKFDTVVDLSKISYKPFKLTGDVNGWFKYILPKAGNEIKFRFLTHRDILSLERITDIEEKSIVKFKLEEMVGLLDNFIDVEDNNISKQDKIKYRQSIRNIEDWKDKIDDTTSEGFTHAITNRLELEVMSIDGNTNRDYIHEFIKNMNVSDARNLRKYIRDNEPGLDYNFEIELPESQGGGSQNVFLQLDKYLFLNVAEE